MANHKSNSVTMPNQQDGKTETGFAVDPYLYLLPPLLTPSLPPSPLFHPLIFMPPQSQQCPPPPLL